MLEVIFWLCCRGLLERSVTRSGKEEFIGALMRL